MGQSVALRGATPCFIGWFHFFLLILALVYPLDSLGHCLRSWPAAVRAPPIPAGCDREGAGTGCGKSHGGIGRTVVVRTAGKCVTVKRGSSKGFPRFRRSSLSYPDCASWEREDTGHSVWWRTRYTRVSGRTFVSQQGWLPQPSQPWACAIIPWGT